MKSISEILQNVDVLSIQGDASLVIQSVVFISNKATDNSLFVSAKGVENEGFDSVDEAIQNGAKAVVFENYEGNKLDHIVYIKVKDARKALYVIAGNFYDNPSLKCKLIGVTGTNGKTTTASSLFQVFRTLGYNCALISTVENKINENTFITTHTTPTPVNLNEFLAKAVFEESEYVFMECSSHGIEEERIGGLRFVGGIFTNLAPEHLDFHGTFEKYADAKKKFFDNLPESAFALSNIDDDKGKYMVRDTKAKVYFYGMDTSADFRATDFHTSINGTEFVVNGEKIKTKFIGRYNGYNLLEVYATTLLLGIPVHKALSVLALVEPPAGRLQFILSKNNICGIVDFAHTPDALLNVLTTLSEIKEPKAKIITVVGCGGGGDITKRPKIGKVSTELSNYTIFTSDNPRKENPEKIIQDLLEGVPQDLKNYEYDIDRAQAIKKAVALAMPGDIVLVAGKGHEKVQVFADKIVPFSDIEELKKSLSF